MAAGAAGAAGPGCSASGGMEEGSGLHGVGGVMRQSSSWAGAAGRLASTETTSGGGRLASSAHPAGANAMPCSYQYPLNPFIIAKKY